MQAFTLTVTEAGKVLGEARVSVTELSFTPETAAMVTAASGRAVPLLGWGDRLWAATREAGADSPPLSFARFAELANAPVREPGFGGEDATFRNPFAPDRFTHPLAVSAGATKAAVKAARLA
jgi:hypothetical protein